MQRLRTRPRQPEAHPLTIDLAIAETALTDLIELEQFGYGRFNYRDHRPYAIDPFSGIWIEGPYLLAFRQSITTPEEASAYLVRLHSLSEALQDTRRRLIADRAAGIYLPRDLARETQERLGQLTSDDPSALGLLATTVEALMRDVPDLESAEREMMLELVGNEVDLVLRPAYMDLITTLSETSDDFANQAGIWALPDGTTLFGDVLEAANGVAVNRDELHQRLNSLTETQKRLLEALLTIPPAAEGEEAPIAPTALSDRLAWFNAAMAEPATETSDALNVPSDGVLESLAPLPVWDRVRMAADDPSQGLAWQIYADLLSESPYSAWGPGEDLPNHRQILEFPAIQDAIRWYIWDQSEVEISPVDRAARAQVSLIQRGLATIDTGLHLERWTLSEATSYMVNMTGLDEDIARQLALSVMAQPGFHAATAIARERIGTLSERAQAVLANRYVELDFQRALLISGPRPLPLLERDIEAWYADLLSN